MFNSAASPPSFVSSILTSPATPDDSESIELQIQPIRSGPRVEEIPTGNDDVHVDEEPQKAEKESRFARFWSNHITVVIPGFKARDHLALERTYLSYHRTSLVLCFFSVLIAQLQVLQHAPHPDPHFGFYVLGKPLAASLIVCAIFVSVMGWVRWWHWQRTLLRGKAMAGGWEVQAVGVVVGLLMVVVFGLVLAVDVKKIYFS
ncbi:hypothetical protein BDD12DRAFT_855570 [Trichophaea hybrida]|nr:hypothetical protein BDD12DRAFT_855570 [Trichophaea hybrida]